MTILTLSLSPFWIPAIGAFLVVSDPIQKADALVVLAGDEDPRLAYAAGLFSQGYAAWFVVTDMDLSPVYPGGIYGERVRRKAIDLGVPAQRILIAPGTVTTTFEEAQVLQAFAGLKGLHSMIVITSPHHTRRARWTLRQVFAGKGLRISIQPIPEHVCPAQEWWQRSGCRRQVAIEYAKILSQLAGYRRIEDFPAFIRGYLESYRNQIIIEQNS